MGIFGTTYGKKKIELIKLLLEDRVRNDPNARDAGFTVYDVRQLSELQLLGTPEGTVVTIAESICELSINKGLSGIEAIGRVDNHRQKFKYSALKRPDHLKEYIQHRLLVELGVAGHLPEEHLLNCMMATEHMLFYPSEQGDAAHALKYAKLQSLKIRHRVIMDATCDYLDGELDQIEFFDKIMFLLEPWQEERIQAKKTA